jgi:hypothetical protein
MPSSVARRALNTAVNPFSDDILDPGFSIGGDRELAKQVARAGALLATYGTGAFAARTMFNKMNKGPERKRRAQLKSYLNARYPIISLDPSVGDTSEEEEARELGLDKAAFSIPGFGKDPKGGVFDSSMRPPKYALALSTAAVLTGLIGGHRLADTAHEGKKKEELRKQLEEKRNLYEKELLGEYQATRLGKTAADDTFKVDAASARVPGPMSTGQSTAPSRTISEAVGSAVHGAGQLYWLYAAGALATAYAVGKYKMDELDPNRQRMKTIQQAARRRARAEQAPVFLEDSDLEGKPGELTTGKPKKVSSVRLPKKQESDLL